MEVRIEENAQIRFGADIPEQFLEKYFFRNVVSQKEDIISKGTILLRKETSEERFQGEIREN